MSVKHKLRPSKPRPVIMMTGFTHSEKTNLASKIQALNGIFVDSEDFNRTCTHIVCKKPSKSEKFLAGCILGKWMLTVDFILKSHANRRWLTEELFEWTDTKILPDGTKCLPELMATPKRCRQNRERDRVGLFAGWMVGVLVENKKRHTVYKRLLEFGDAVVLDLQFPIKDLNEVKRTFTYLFVDKHYTDSVSKLVEMGIPCLCPDYIGDFIVKELVPDLQAYYIKAANSNTNILLDTGSDTSMLSSCNNTPEIKLPKAESTPASCLSSKPMIKPDINSDYDKPLSQPEQKPVVRLKKANLFAQKRKRSPDELQQQAKQRKISQDWKPCLPNKFQYSAVFPKSNKESAIIASTLPSSFLSLFESCFEENHCLAALDALMSTISANFYPSAKTLHGVMVNILMSADNCILAEKASKVLHMVLQLHPPVTSATQDLYLDTFSGGQLNNMWTFIKNLLSPPGTWLQEVTGRLSEDQFNKNRHILLDYIIDILDCDFSYFASCYADEDKPIKQCMVSRILWPGGQKWRVLSTQCRELLELLGSKLRDIVECPEQERSLKVLLRLITMVCECCQVVDIKNNSKGLGKGERASTFISEVMHKISAGCANDSRLLDSVLKKLFPTWLRLKVCDLLLDSYDISLLPENCDRTEPLNLRKIVSQYFYLLPPLDSAGHQKKGEKPLSAVSNVGGSFAGSPSTTPTSSPLKLKKFSEVSRNTTPTKHSPRKATATYIMKRNIRGENQLHLACIRNNVPRLKELLSVQGIDVNAVDNAGWSPLHEACNHGHMECVMELLKYKPLKTITSYFSKENKSKNELNLTVANEDGVTPLHDAVINNHTEVVKALLKAGGSRLLSVQTKDGLVPLACATSDEMRDILKLPVNKLTVTPTKRRINLCADFSMIDSQLSQSSILEDLSSSYAFLPSDEVYSSILGSGMERKLASLDEGNKYVTLVYHLLIAYLSSPAKKVENNGHTEDDKVIIKELCGHVRGFEMHLNRILNTTEPFKPKLSAMKCLAYI